MPKQSLSKEQKELLDALLKANKEKKEATNTFNRNNTVIRNMFKERIQTKDWHLGTFIHYQGHKISYDSAESTVIEPEDLYALLKDGEITEEQFLKCISVRKGDVSKNLGSDVSLTLEKPVKGDNYGVKIAELPIDEAKSEYVSVTVPDKIIRRKKKPLSKVTSSTPVKERIRRPVIKRR